MIKKILVALIINRIIAGILYSLLIVHFLVLFAYQLPDNPINHRFKMTLESYINPQFAQKWSLFSPNPANSNQTIQVKFISYKNGYITNFNWVDIVTPLIKEKNNNFWTPSQRPLKFLNSCASNIIDLRIKIWEAETKKKIKIDSLVVLNNIEKHTTKSPGNYGILNYSKMVYHNLKVKSKPDSVLVEYKIVDAFFPRFSKRELDYFSEKNYRYTSIWVKPTRIF